MASYKIIREINNVDRIMKELEEQGYDRGEILFRRRRANTAMVAHLISIVVIFIATAFIAGAVKDYKLKDILSYVLGIPFWYLLFISPIIWIIKRIICAKKIKRVEKATIKLLSNPCLSWIPSKYHGTKWWRLEQDDIEKAYPELREFALKNLDDGEENPAEIPRLLEEAKARAEYEKKLAPFLVGHTRKEAERLLAEQEEELRLFEEEQKAVEWVKKLDEDMKERKRIAKGNREKARYEADMRFINRTIGK